jgi:hypothetical protein
MPDTPLDEATEPTASTERAADATPASVPGTPGTGDATEQATDTATTKPWPRRHPKSLAAAAILTAAGLIATVIALVLPGDKPAPAPYTVAVTYKVTGEGRATVTYNTGHPDKPGGRAQLVKLPWTKELLVNPESGLARVSMVLGEDGGTAQCSIAVQGEHRQRATAVGNFGRATCSAKVPEQAGSAS